MKHLLLGLILIFFAHSLMGIDFTVDGINYTTTGSNTVSIVKGGNYSGELIIPSTVTFSSETYTVSSIGDRAFSYKGGLTSIVIPNSVYSIGERAFEYCSRLVSISITDSVKSIKPGAFNNCTILSDVRISNSMDSIESHTFFNCDGLQNIEIPNSIKYIGWEAFGSCNGLVRIEIPTSVTDIEERAFYFCSASFTVDGNNPEYSSLEGLLYNKEQSRLIQCPTSKSGSYLIPNTVLAIEKHAFYKCQSLSDVSVPSSVSSIPGEAFWGCSGLINVDDNNAVYTSIDGILYSKRKGHILNCPTSKSGNFEIPGSVFEISKGAFFACESLTSILIPNTVSSIEYYAFWGCKGLSSIYVPNSVTELGNEVFAYCSGLTEITIPNSFTTIGYYQFMGCSSLESFTIGDSVTSIERGAFKDCSRLKSIIIPRTVSSIGAYSFSGCSSLKSISFQGSIASIGSETFKECTSLTSISLPHSVNKIERGAFNKCSNLSKINIPGWTTEIGYAAFSMCSNMNSIYAYPVEPVLLSSSPFYSVDLSACTLYVPIGSKSSYQAANVWKNFANIVEFDASYEVVFFIDGINYSVPQTKDMVSVDAGENYSGEISIPPKITFANIDYTVSSIADSAFFECPNLKSISIPDSVTSIGQAAFYNCTGLNTIIVHNADPVTISEDVFYSVNKTACILYVPFGSKNLYLEASVWKEFQSIIEYEPSAIHSRIPTLPIQLKRSYHGIEISNMGSRATVWLYNIQGRLVQKCLIEADETITTPNLPIGIYIVRATTQTGQYCSKALIQ